MLQFGMPTLIEIDRLADTMELCKELGLSFVELNIKIYIENTNGYREYEKTAIEFLLKSELFGLTWDIGHSNSANNIDEKFILENENKLCHFHIHDSLQKQDHMTLGTGEVDLKQRLDILSFTLSYHCCSAQAYYTKTAHRTPQNP